MGTMTMYRLTDTHNVRQAEIADVPRIAEIWLEGAKPTFGELVDKDLDVVSVQQQLLKLVEQQTENFKFWLCVDRASAIVGWSTVQPLHNSPLEKMRNAYGLVSTYMASSCQGQGVGGQLLSFVIDYCKKHTTISLVFGFQDRSNIGSVTIGDRVGFMDHGTLPQIDGLPPVSLIVCVTDK
jgi:L-amino acid N-acyltransferase YncA